jgi:transcriptional regulator with XRE-family HTH domain
MGRALRWRPEHLAEKLRFIREALELSQNELIGEMGLTGRIYQQHIHAYESGRLIPPLPVLLEYARLAGGRVEGANTGRYLEILIDDDLELPKRLPNSEPPVRPKRHKIRPTKFRRLRET